MKPNTPFFIFDVESIGLHGEGFAVAGGVYLANGAAQYEFAYSCPMSEAKGVEEDRQWVKENVPILEITHRMPIAMRDEFWKQWTEAKSKYPDITMAVECGWPVEARFLAACINDFPEGRRWEGPYPLQEIASLMTAAGMEPMANYPRTASELPAHNPLTDARLSARLLSTALVKLQLLNAR